MLAESSGAVLVRATTDGVAETTAQVENTGGGGSSNSGGGSDEGGGGLFGSGGNRWPRQETLALLKIRSDMDAAFRDANVKGPLWEQVSRKLAELGYNRNGKKCKEKFENVYKYHKRTKDSRTAKSEGKNYRFFEQLQALDQHHHHNHLLITNSTPPSITASTVPSNTNTVPLIAMPQSTTTVTPPITNPSSILPPPATATSENPFSSPSPDMSTSSYTSSDVRDGKRKRKWQEFLERITKEMIQKQEELQRKFLETIEKRERERTAREDAWRMQEMSRFNREREILAQERSMAAAKDAALMAFLQKISDQQNLKTPLSARKQQTNTINNNKQPEKSTPIPPPPPSAATPVMSQPLAVVLPQPQPGMQLVKSKTENGGANLSSRWPKVEIQALIRLRTNLDLKYLENGPKGPLWEEISAGMRNLGYDRNPKRCKEKWENINKYYKKVKESNKKRPEDSKTCPYFDELDALYKDKIKLITHDQLGSNNNINWSSTNSTSQLNPVALAVVQPEQQWPPAMEDQNLDEDEDDITDKDDDDDDDDEEDENGGGGFEIVANKPS